MSNTMRRACSKCGRVKTMDRFFASKRGEKDDICKECLLEHVDNNDPETFKWILERYDIPYNERLWVGRANKEYLANPGRFGPASVIGKYMRDMKMAQYKRFGYKDSDNPDFVFLVLAKDGANEALLKQRLDAGEISQAEYDTMSVTADGGNPHDVKKVFTAKSDYVKSVNESLTDEDRMYLMLKWGTSYSADEWVRMERMYKKYCGQYDMSVDREETLKKLCRTSVKMDKALEHDDMLDYKNLSQVYDSLRKTGKFTDQQNKEDRSDVVDSVGQLVLLCERDGGIIEQFPDPEEYPQDKIDATLNHFKQYSVNLLRNEPNVAGLIETYITKLEQADEKTKQFMATMSDRDVPPGPDDDDEEVDEDGS